LNAKKGPEHGHRGEAGLWQETEKKRRPKTSLMYGERGSFPQKPESVARVTGPIRAFGGPARGGKKGRRLSVKPK